MNRVYDEISTRDAFGHALAEYSNLHPNLYYVAADTLKSVGGAKMHDRYPNRALNVGISEQNMALMAAGMASCGAKVVAASYAVFCSMRITEQIRTFICYPKLDVKIVAGLGGMSGDQEGVTHQGTEDIGALRSIPNLAIVAAADAASTKVITRKILDYNGPVYLRLGRNPSATVFHSDYAFELGKANIMRNEGSDVAIFTAGGAVVRAKEASEMLIAGGCGVQLIEMPTIKPIDREAVLRAARETHCIVVVEDHNIIGGLGSAIAEVLSEEYPCKTKRIGIEGFTESADYDELLDKYNLSPGHIMEMVKEAIKEKQAHH